MKNNLRDLIMAIEKIIRVLRAERMHDQVLTLSEFKNSMEILKMYDKDSIIKKINSISNKIRIDTFITACDNPKGYRDLYIKSISYRDWNRLLLDFKTNLITIAQKK